MISMISISREEAPDQMDLSLLSLHCARELNRHRRKEAGDDCYCIELFHRAMTQHIDQSWSVLQQLFGEVVRIWLRSHPHRDIALRQDSEENYIAQTFTRFWYATHEQQLEFKNLRAALSYLHATLHGLLIDTLRSHLRSKNVPLPEPGFPCEPTQEDTSGSAETWDAIQSLLDDTREQRVAYLLYYCGLKPREIVARCPTEFPYVKEIYRLNENIIERLRRNQDRLRWLLVQN